jgi:hypothetical protein
MEFPTIPDQGRENEQHPVKDPTQKSSAKKHEWVGCLLLFLGLLAYGIIAFLLASCGASIILQGLTFGGFILLFLFVQQKRQLDIIGLGLGICLLAGSGFLYFKTQNFINRSLVTEGVVVGYEGNDEDYWLYEFMTVDRETIQFRDNYMPGASKGEAVKVIYNPLNPSEARIDKWFALWSMPVVTFCVGIPAVVLAVLRLLRQR